MQGKGCRKGSAVVDVVIFAAIVVFVILPVFSIIMEKYVLLNKAQIIKDAIDMTGISVYNAINTAELAKAGVDVDETTAEEIYRNLLALNLKLDDDLKPLPGSLAEDTVSVRSLIIFSDMFPAVCPLGASITRPSVHSVVVVPVRPSLYRRLVLGMIGRQFVELEVHVDSEIPVNN
ncbi:MAG: hypothetical protein FIA99_10405 [Ruminiclostridium sp.]|nr:hypothetical protein [Ruminiclostridium sp.]